VGIEKVQVCTREIYFEFIEKRREVLGRTPKSYLTLWRSLEGETTSELLNTLKKRLIKEFFEQVQGVHKTNTFRSVGRG
jgi:hypothetical protein